MIRVRTIRRLPPSQQYQIEHLEHLNGTSDKMKVNEDPTPDGPPLLIPKKQESTVKEEVKEELEEHTDSVPGGPTELFGDFEEQEEDPPIPQPEEELPEESELPIEMETASMFVAPLFLMGTTFLVRRFFSI